MAVVGVAAAAAAILVLAHAMSLWGETERLKQIGGSETYLDAELLALGSSMLFALLLALVLLLWGTTAVILRRQRRRPVHDGR